MPFETVPIDTDRGSCPAWIIPPNSAEADSGLWLIHLHGIRSTRSVVLPGVGALKGLPITSLVPSWRGDTEGPATAGGGSALGWAEWHDVDRALEYARNHGARSIVLVGWSMGGTIAGMLLRSSRLAADIVGLVLVAPVTSWRAVVANAVSSARLPSFTTTGVEFVLANPVLCRLAGLREPVRLKDLEVGGRTDRAVPMLVIHNPDDELVPHGLVVDFVVRNAPHAELAVFDGSPHAMEWNLNPERFESTVKRWVKLQIALMDPDAVSGTSRG